MSGTPSISRRSMMNCTGLGFLTTLFARTAKAERHEIFLMRSFVGGRSPEEMARIKRDLKPGDLLGLKPHDDGRNFYTLYVFAPNGESMGNTYFMLSEPIVRLCDAGYEIRARLAPPIPDRPGLRYTDIDLFLVA